jgi:Ca2+-binding RTX toxin-like protein
MRRGIGRLVRRFSLASAVAMAFAALALASAPGAAAQESLAASCEPPRETSTIGQPTWRFAQTFTSALTGSLTRAEIEILEGDGSGDWIVEIRTEDVDGPTAVILASATVPDASVPPGESLLSVVFAAPAAVVAGQEYALVIGRPGTGIDTNGVGFRFGNDCPGRAWLSSDSGATWSPFGEEIDIPFRVFIASPAQVVADCKGQQATHVGTPGNDEITGTPARDVIAALGGRDEVSGLAGKDLICGGSGRDTLKGGKGKDKLFGQGGRDRLRGGGAKDVCKGGKGDDSAKCEVEKSI